MNRNEFIVRSLFLLFLAVINACCLNSEKAIVRSEGTIKTHQIDSSCKIDKLILNTDFQEVLIYIYQKDGIETWIVFPNDTLYDCRQMEEEPRFVCSTENGKLELYDSKVIKRFIDLRDYYSEEKPLPISNELVHFTTMQKRQLTPKQLKEWFPYYYFPTDSLLEIWSYYSDLDQDDVPELIVDFDHPTYFFRYYASIKNGKYFLNGRSDLYHEFSCQPLSKTPNKKSHLVWIEEYNASTCGGYCTLTGIRFHKGEIIQLGSFVVDQTLDSSCGSIEDENSVWKLTSNVKSQTQERVVVSYTFTEFTYPKSNPKKRTYRQKGRKLEFTFNWNEETGSYDWDNSSWPWLKNFPIQASEFSELFQVK